MKCSTGPMRAEARFPTCRIIKLITHDRSICCSKHISPKIAGFDLEAPILRLVLGYINYDAHFSDCDLGPTLRCWWQGKQKTTPVHQ